MKLIRGSDILAIGDAMRSLEDLAEGGDRASWKARALAAESKLARLEGLERAAREYEGAAKKWLRTKPGSDGSAKFSNALTGYQAAVLEAARAFAENGE